MEQENKKPIFPLFNFKNEETAIELRKAMVKVLSLCEGVTADKVDEYLMFAHLSRCADAQVDVKVMLINLWKSKYPDLSYTDIVGVIDTALNDIKIERINKGNDMMKKLRRGARI